MTNEIWDIIFIERTDWYTNLIKLVRYKFEACVPLVKVSRQSIREKPWITKELKIIIKEKNKLYRVYLTKSDQRSKIRYNQQRNIVRNAHNIAETNYYNELFENTKDSTYNLWKNLGPVINPKKKRQGNYINKVIKDGKCMSDPHGIANALNEYFCNIGNEYQAQFTNTDDQYLTYLPEEIMQNSFLQPITASQVKCEIVQLNSKKNHPVMIILGQR